MTQGWLPLDWWRYGQNRLVRVWAIALIVSVSWLAMAGGAVAWADGVSDRDSTQRFTSPQPSPTILTQGIELATQGNYQAALEKFTQVIHQQANRAATDESSSQPLQIAYSNRCLMWIYMEDYSAALHDCEQALQLRPDDEEALVNHGLAAYRLGQYETTVADNSRRLAMGAADLRSYFNRALAETALGQYTNAVADFTHALGLPQTPPEADHADHAAIQAEIYIDRGLAYFAMADWSGAIADLDQAIILNGNSDRAYYNRGCVCSRQRNYRAAIRDFSQALKLNPHNPEAYLNRAMAYRALGSPQLAKRDLQHAAHGFQLQGQVAQYQRVQTLMQQLQQQPKSAFA